MVCFIRYLSSSSKEIPFTKTLLTVVTCPFLVHFVIFFAEPQIIAVGPPLKWRSGVLYKVLYN